MAEIDLYKMLEEQKKREIKERNKRKRLEQKIWEQKYKPLLEILKKRDREITQADIEEIAIDLTIKLDEHAKKEENQ